MKIRSYWLAALLATGSLSAQSVRSAPDVDFEFQAWRASHGQNWRVREDASTGFAAMLYGGSATPGSVPDTNDPQAWFQLARDWVDATKNLHGTDSTELVEG